MSERLYGFYQDELAFIREEIREFGGRFNKVASRLHLASGSVEDPHVSRLVDSFALLTARLRLKIEDEFPEICQAMLQSLYPQYLAPVPSMAICQFELDEVGADLVQGFTIKRGSQIDTDEIDGQVCHFRTCFDLELFPVKVSNSEYFKTPFPFPTPLAWADKAESAIRMELTPISSKMDWSKTDVKRLRFYLGGSNQCGNKLCEAILRDAIGVGLISDQKKDGLFLSSNAISQTGFDIKQGILDHDPRTLASYQTLWEYFALPEKFRTIEIDFDGKWGQVAGNNLQIVIYLRRAHPIIQRHITRDAIMLGCTPVVNLFEKDAEPIQLTENQVEYRVVPSYRTVTGMEVHTISKVTASRPGGDGEMTFLPFHRPAHQALTSDRDRYWHSSRRRRVSDDSSGDRGTEVFLTVVDLHSRPSPADEWTLHVQTLCCNRDLVTHLGLLTPIHFGAGPVKVAFRTSPSPTQRPINQDDWVWRLISHLSLNHLSLATDSKGELLREVLGLYNSSDQEDVHKAIDSIRSVSYRRATARIPDSGKGPGICRGIEIHLELDEERFEGNGAFVFATVLDRFFSLFATINSFTRLVVRSKGDSQLLFEGRARSGAKILI